MRAAVMGLAVAGVTSFLVWQYMKRFEDEASGGPKIEVLTVVRTIEPGSVLREGDIGVRGIPVAYVDSRAIRATDRQRIANLPIASALEAQQILTWSDVVASADERSLSGVVQPGMRAVAIHTEGRSSSLPNRGDRVDVLATLPAPNSTDARVGVVLLQNIMVLGHPVGGTGTVNADGTDTILSLTLQQSQLLAVAGDKAKLTLALRSKPDQIVGVSLGEIKSTDLLTPPAPPPAAKGPGGPAAMKSVVK